MQVVAMNADRVKNLNDADGSDGRCVLYWMQQSQRAAFNPALEHAIQRANDLDVPVLVAFALDEAYPEGNARHFFFMLQGLADVAMALRKRSIPFVVRRGSPPDVIPQLAEDAALLVCDRGYLRHQKRWREDISGDVACRVEQVEGDVVVPVDVVSSKREYAARTIRPKLEEAWNSYLTDVTETKPKCTDAIHVESDLDVSDPEAALENLNVDISVGPVTRFTGGTSEARKRLASFLRSGLSGYADARNDPSDPQCSHLSPYLHFGHISPVEVALKAQNAKSGSNEDVAAFLEELIVRRELAINFVHHEPDYDSFSALPDWARETLADHRDDDRPARYTAKQLEAAETDDPYWNAAMLEMKKTGYMHNHMRMYWGKQILAWCNTPEYAYRTALTLNNRYFLDGRDPNSYANIGWIFGLHDRPYKERAVFGKVRPMTASGLERKFDIHAYVEWVDGLPE